MGWEAAMQGDYRLEYRVCASENTTEEFGSAPEATIRALFLLQRYGIGNVTLSIVDVRRGETGAVSYEQILLQSKEPRYP